MTATYNEGKEQKIRMLILLSVAFLPGLLLAFINAWPGYLRESTIGDPYGHRIE